MSNDDRRTFLKKLGLGGLAGMFAFGAKKAEAAFEAVEPKPETVDIPGGLPSTGWTGAVSSFAKEGQIVDSPWPVLATGATFSAPASSASGAFSPPTTKGLTIETVDPPEFQLEDEQEEFIESEKFTKGLTHFAAATRAGTVEGRTEEDLRAWRRLVLRNKKW